MNSGASTENDGLNSGASTDREVCGVHSGASVENTKGFASAFGVHEGAAAFNVGEVGVNGLASKFSF